MASRERKRAERQKRKARTAERRAELAARSEARNQAAREALEPLAENERPTVVTVAAALISLLVVSIVVAWLAGANVDGDRPNVVQVIVPALLMGTMAYGLWRARYWAVLGFQALLALLVVSGSIGLIAATSALQAIGTAALVAVAGTLFFLMIKAMARIQMPKRKPPE